MIIKGLFRRYQRWNPVHPTLGAFWGMGLGIGCGVGWGPGFGPEVIGYVGAGCGAGFCVGITLAGIGIGLPANYVYTLPYNALVAARTGALGIAESNSVRSMKNVAGDGWSNLRGTIPGLQQKGSQMLPGFGIRNPLENMLDISNVKNAIFSSSTPMMNELQRIRSHFFPPHKGSKE
ncbi:cadmium-induced protein AS8 [Coffea eugenioides]|uniref:cadmium-induced protein AS8 n=1 Tax=Coffea eugenioides TaxID=49369 RepID=UPI000F60C41C|nr:cadmium-induced protein AS8 [Coffea eugenioides]XP_027182697.1 cadmium-induced protein AS8 [Coffea eugenioides]